MSAVDAAITEIETERGENAPILEGLRDYSRLNLEPGTAAEVAAFILIYEHRIELLNTALGALQILAADGHPDIPHRLISAEEYADLVANRDTILAALAQFDAAAALAASLGLTANPPEPK